MVDPGCQRDAVDPLLTICAQLLAKHPLQICRIEKNFKYSLEQELALPLRCSEALFQSLLHESNSQEFAGKLLNIFTDATKTPLTLLNLENSDVDDTTLALLLRAHASRLTCLNISNCSSLSEDLNAMLTDLHVPELLVLNLGGLVRLFALWRSDPYPEDCNVESPTECTHYPSQQQSSFFSDTVNASSAQVDLCDMSIGCNTEVQATDGDFVTACSSQSTAQLSNHGRFGNNVTACCPHLAALIFHGEEFDILFPEMHEDAVYDFWAMLLAPIQKLRYLDICDWPNLGDLRFLRSLTLLEVLILYNVPDLDQAFETLSQLKRLRHLDLSQADVAMGTYPLPARWLYGLTSALPALRSLDISCTNLSNHPGDGDWPIINSQPKVVSDIIGLRGLQEPLEFLGLFNSENNAAHFAHLPASYVTGDATEAQMLLACERYLNRPGLLRKVLNECYQLYRYGEPHMNHRALELILPILEKHLDDTTIQISGSAALFYVMKPLATALSSRLKRRVANAFLSALDEHIDENILVRNCCLSLCQFEIPKDIMHKYISTVRLLLRILNEHATDQMVQRVVVYLLNSTACFVDGAQKIAVGDEGAIELINELIATKYEAGVCDEVMEVSWSFLWNITDETPVNCDRFLKANGLNMFYKCYERFPEHKKLLRNMMGLMKFPTNNELVRNMMGLMGNISEVKELRPELMKRPFVESFCKLLENLSEGIEISYNSAGVLAHMCSDGEKAWTLFEPSHSAVTEAMITAIGKWNLQSQRFINYRSFEPILRLLPLYDCAASQYWAVFALANLTSITADKYCMFVIKEGGLPLLDAFLADARPRKEMKELARLVLANVEKWQAEASARQVHDNESLTDDTQDMSD